jgi:hypothetical protein
MENVDATKTEPKTEAPAEAKTEAHASYVRFAQKLVDEVKEAGKGGKKQWEDAVKSTRDLLARAKPPLKRDELEKLATTVKTTIQERGDAWTSSERFLKARDKGAQFLIKIAQRVKEAALNVETNLQQAVAR